MPIRPENRARYPKDWPAISQRIRFERAGGRCECDGRCASRHCIAAASRRQAEVLKYSPVRPRCTARNGQAHPSTRSRVILTVAHLDHRPENCDDANLLAMCQACHLHYDRDHHAETARATRAAAVAATTDALFELAGE